MGAIGVLQTGSQLCRNSVHSDTIPRNQSQLNQNFRKIRRYSWMEPITQRRHCRSRRPSTTFAMPNTGLVWPHGFCRGASAVALSRLGLGGISCVAYRCPAIIRRRNREWIILARSHFWSRQIAISPSVYEIGHKTNTSEHPTSCKHSLAAIGSPRRAEIAKLDQFHLARLDGASALITARAPGLLELLGKKFHGGCWSRTVRVLGISEGIWIKSG